MEHGFWYSLGAIARNGLRAESALFRLDLDESLAKRLFRDHVELIEVETTSYCNRTCSFCPNVTIDRRSEKHSMPESTWHSILSSLEQIDYRGTLVWSGYSEPLSERRIVERLRQVRHAAPKCRIAINSNGDYLDEQFLDELAAASLNRLWIDLYLPDQSVYELEVARSHLDRFLSRIGNPKHRIVSQSPELSCRMVHPALLEIGVTCRNSASMRNVLSTRAGLLRLENTSVRTSPCFAPFKHLVIDWDGSLVVCCQMRSDAAAHSEGILGTVGRDFDLVEGYARLASWRASLVRFGKKSEPCAKCNHGEYRENGLIVGLSNALAGIAVPDLVRAKAAQALKRRRF